MAIGRVPGPALLPDLDRQGIDLSWTTSASTLMQMDFSQFRIGINTDTPDQELEVVGNVLVTSGRVILPSINNATLPSLSFGDGDTGFYEQADDQLIIAVAGAARFYSTQLQFGAVETNGSALINENTSVTNPTLVPNRLDDDTGIGADVTGDTLSLIAGSVEGARIYSSNVHIVHDTVIGHASTTPLSRLHVYSGDSGLVTPHTVADDLVIENNTSAGITISTPQGGGEQGALLFATSLNNFEAGLQYTPDSRQLFIGTNEATGSIMFRTDTAANTLQIESDGTLNVAGVTNYETLVTSDDDIPNKKYVDDSLLGTNLSLPLTFEQGIDGLYSTAQATDLTLNMFGQMSDHFQDATLVDVETDTGGGYGSITITDSHRNMFAGYPEIASLTFPSTTIGARFTFQTQQSFPLGGYFMIYQEWTTGGPKSYTITLERASDAAMTSPTTLISSSTTTAGEYFYFEKVTDHTSESYYRLTLDISGRADDIGFRQFRMWTNRLGFGQYKGLPFEWDINGIDLASKDLITTGNVNLNTESLINFEDDATVRDLVRLYGDGTAASTYGIGIEPGAATYRVGNTGAHRWYVNDIPDGGASDVMELDASGLNINGGLIATGEITTDGAWLRVNRTSDAATAAIYLDADDGYPDYLYLRTAGVNRWIVGKTAINEASGNVGSNFSIARYSNVGSYIDTPFAIARNTGLVSISNNLDISGDLEVTNSTTLLNGVAITNGITMGSTVASAVDDVSEHLDLYGGNYGLSITASTMNLVSAGARRMSISNPITSHINHDFLQGIDVTGNITVTGLVDGRDVATDGSTLDTHIALVNEHIDWTGASAAFSTTGGATFTGVGINFGSSTVSGTDLTEHIDLYGGSYGINVIGGNIQFISNGSTVAQIGTTRLRSILNHDFDAGIDVTGNITVTGIVDGRDIAADGAVLDTALQPADIGTTVLAHDSNLQSFVDAFTLPTVDGANLDVVVTDGVGNLSFLTIPGIGIVELGAQTTGHFVRNVFGTTNEVEVTGTGFENANVTVGLPADVTISNTLTVSGAGTVSADLLGDVTGNLTGNVLIDRNDSGNITTYLSFVESVTSGTQRMHIDANLTYNPSTGVLGAQATTAQYADLSEKYLADAEYEAGTVLEFGGDYEVTQCNSINTHRVAGIVTTSPAFRMNTGLTGEYVADVALRGRVPCKVSGGIIQKGDLMVSAGNGCATVDNTPNPGAIIGKALQDFPGGEGVIEIVVG